MDHAKEIAILNHRRRDLFDSNRIYHKKIERSCSIIKFPNIKYRIVKEIDCGPIEAGSLQDAIDEARRFAFIRGYTVVDEGYIITDDKGTPRYIKIKQGDLAW